MKNRFVHTKIASALLFLILTGLLLCSSAVFSDTGILINNSKVTVNTTYRGDISLSLVGNPKIRLILEDISSENESGNVTSSYKLIVSRTNTICPKRDDWVSVNESTNVTCSFVTYADYLRSGRYSYSILVKDWAGNERYDEKNFTVELPFEILDENCYNDIKDGSETDLNCGGPGCLCCETPKICKVDNDCCSAFCRQGFCAEPRCDDLMRNGFESDVDCGGSCPGCDEGKNCKSDSDCITGFCNSQGICASPSCDDNSKNGFESDVDCGGANCSKCANGMNCFSSADCDSDYCESGYCACDNSKDTDGDRMPDCWELKYNLDPNNPDDAEEDLDGDGKSNLDEYLDGSDPTDPTDPFQEKSHLLGIILLILGFLLMGGSTGFLVYSRKVLVPKEKLSQRAQQQPGQPSSVQQGQRPSQSGGPIRPGVTGAASQQPGKGSSIAQALAQRRLAKQQGAMPGTAPAFVGSRPGARQANPGKGNKAGSDSDEYIPLSDLGKNKDKGKSNDNTDKGVDKDKPKAIGAGNQAKLSSVFDRLKELTSQKEKGKENDKNDKDGKEKK